MGKYRVFVLEDEGHARRQLVDWLEALDEVIEVVAAASVAHARECLSSFEPDVMFLDIELGDGISFELLPADPKVGIIFTTAYDVYAVRAFRVNAIDYLLKPFDQDDIRQALQRLERRVDVGRPKSARPKILKVKHNGVTQFILADDIDRVTSEDYYSAFHVGERSFLTRKSIAQLAEELGPYGHVRVHRSTLVNLKAVSGIKSNGSGGLDLILSGDRKVAVSRSYAAEIRRRFEAMAAE